MSTVLLSTRLVLSNANSKDGSDTHAVAASFGTSPFSCARLAVSARARIFKAPLQAQVVRLCGSSARELSSVSISKRVTPRVLGSSSHHV